MTLKTKLRKLYFANYILLFKTKVKKQIFHTEFKQLSCWMCSS